FFFQAEDGIRDDLVTGVQTCALPIWVDNYPTPGGPIKAYAKEKFIFTFQDVRGRNGSAGEYVHMRPHKPVKRDAKDIDESTDTRSEERRVGKECTTDAWTYEGETRSR